MVYKTWGYYICSITITPNACFSFPQAKNIVTKENNDWTDLVCRNVLNSILKLVKPSFIDIVHSIALVFKLYLVQMCDMCEMVNDKCI